MSKSELKDPQSETLERRLISARKGNAESSHSKAHAKKSGKELPNTCEELDEVSALTSQRLERLLESSLEIVVAHRAILNERLRAIQRRGLGSLTVIGGAHKKVFVNHQIRKGDLVATYRPEGVAFIFGRDRRLIAFSTEHSSFQRDVEGEEDVIREINRRQEWNLDLSPESFPLVRQVLLGPLEGWPATILLISSGAEGGFYSLGAEVAQSICPTKAWKRANIILTPGDEHEAKAAVVAEAARDISQGEELLLYAGYSNLEGVIDKQVENIGDPGEPLSRSGFRKEFGRLSRASPGRRAKLCDFCLGTRSIKDKTRKLCQCKSRRYCSSSCQFGDWKTHKKFCPTQLSASRSL